LIATHDLEDVIAYADRLVLMKDGKVVKNGRPADLIDGLVQFGMREPRAACPKMGVSP
jgi:energy-coupling factor transporter ATP-binding protein EcfA2